MSKRFEIAMIDDDQDDLDMMTESFDAIDYLHSFKPFTSGKSFLSYLDTLPETDDYPSLAILDYSMPELSGEETLEYIRRQQKYDNITVIFLSSGISPYQKIRLESKGSVCCILKPSTYHEYIQVARDLKLAIEDKYRLNLTKVAITINA